MQVTRRQAREWAIQMLSAADLNPPEDVTRFILDFWAQISTMEHNEGGGEPNGTYKKFAEERVIGVLEHLDEIDDILRPLLDNWDLYRLGTVERAVLRMGIFEISYTDVPAPVVINESIDLANWFSTPKSRSIVNGVLDKYAKRK